MEVCFSVPPKSRKDFVKQILFPKTSRGNNWSQNQALYIDKSHTKIQALLVNFDGISDIGLKGCPNKSQNTFFCRITSYC